MGYLEIIFYGSIWLYIGQDYFRSAEENMLKELRKFPVDTPSAFKVLFILYLFFWPGFFVMDAIRFLWIKLGEA